LIHALCFFECCSDYWVPKNMTELEVRLNKHLMGQPMAHNLIIKSLRAHFTKQNPKKALVLSLHGSTGTGKNFIAKHIVESIYREGFQSKYVRLYVASNDFSHDDAAHLRLYKTRIQNDIEKATATCPHAIFIFDEVDKMPFKLLESLKFYIDFHVPTKAKPIDFRRTIFIFLSNTGGIALNQIAYDYHFAAIPRERYNVTQLQMALTNAAFNEAGGLWHATLISHHLVDFFVPFLPLERQHVRKCIEERYDFVMETDESDYSLTRNEIVDQVLDQIEFFPPDSLLYSISGCKRVPQRLDYVLEHHRIERDTLNSEL